MLNRNILFTRLFDPSHQMKTHPSSEFCLNILIEMSRWYMRRKCMLIWLKLWFDLIVCNQLESWVYWERKISRYKMHCNRPPPYQTACNHTSKRIMKFFLAILLVVSWDYFAWIIVTLQYLLFNFSASLLAALSLSRCTRRNPNPKALEVSAESYPLLGQWLLRLSSTSFKFNKFDAIILRIPPNEK